LRPPVPADVLKAIGNTSLVRLRKVVPPDCADILVKIEWENPTGSVKDRMASAVISRAEEDGRLRPGDTVVEYTGGSTGTSLAFVCAAKGYRIRIVSSDAFSREKLDHMAALGAELTLVPSEGGQTTKKLILDMVEAARAVSREPSSTTRTPSRATTPSARRSGTRRRERSTPSFIAWARRPPRAASLPF
jgi:cysteine synthase A